jgi:hypothetical protein
VGLAVLLAGCPEVRVTPSDGPAGASGLPLTIYGTNTHFAAGQTEVSFPAGSGIHVDDVVVVSETEAEVEVSIDATAAVGPTVLTATTGDETASTTFTVTPRPTITVSPGFAEQGTPGLVLTISGQGTHFTAPGFAVYFDIPGVTMVGSPVVVDDTTATVALNVGLGAEVGSHPGSIRISTDYQEVGADFTVLAVTGRRIEITPGAVEAGTTTPVAVTGFKTEFDEDSEVTLDPPDDVVVTHTVLSPTSISVVLAASSHAEPGMRRLVVTDPYGTLSAPLEIMADQHPPAVSFNPAAAMPRQDPVVVATGTNTSFASGETSVEVEPANGGLSFSVLEVVDPTQARLQATVDLHATLGTYSVTLRTGPEEVTGTFLVQPLPEASATITPATGRQGEQVAVTITGSFTHFEAGTTLMAPSGIVVEDLVRLSDSTLTATLVIDDTAGVGSTQLQVSTESWAETVEVGFEVTPGLPVVTLLPQSAAQATTGQLVQATGRFVSWTGATEVVPEAPCAITVHDVVVSGAGQLSFAVDVPDFHAVGPCTLRFTDADPAKEALAVLEITPTYDPVTIPDEIVDFLDVPHRYGVTLQAGEVLRARVVRDHWTLIDPVLSLYAVGNNPAVPLIENDDESLATRNSRVVFQAPVNGVYFLVVRDRLGFNQGGFTLSLDYYVPTSLLETSPITAPDSSLDRGTATDLGAPGLGTTVRGRFQNAGDLVDVYRVTTNEGDRLAVSVAARSVSPAERSTADVTVRVYSEPVGPPLAVSTVSVEHPDPIVYVTAQGNELWIEVERPAESLAETTYWLTVRPWLVINEFLHDETTEWLGGFVELLGEPGASTEGCSVSLVADGAVVADVPLQHGALAEPYAIDPLGYLVVAHDDLVAGVDSIHVQPNLVVDDPNGLYTDLVVQLRCNEALLDEVQYRGGALPDQPGVALGRGFGISTGNAAQDFRPQLEASPWFQNVSEVP